MVVKEVNLKAPIAFANVMILLLLAIISVVTAFKIPQTDASLHQTNVFATSMIYFIVAIMAYAILNLISVFMLHLFLVFLFTKLKPSPESQFKKMYSELFKKTPVYIDQGFTGSYLNAICYDGEFLYIIERNKIATLIWSDVRSWIWEQEDAITGDLALTNNAGRFLRNVKASAQSGLTIDVKSVDYPRWFFNTGNDKKGKATCNKWNEIFKQFNDGTLPITH